MITRKELLKGGVFGLFAAALAPLVKAKKAEPKTFYMPLNAHRHAECPEGYVEDTVTMSMVGPHCRWRARYYMLALDGEIMTTSGIHGVYRDGTGFGTFIFLKGMTEPKKFIEGFLHPPMSRPLGFGRQEPEFEAKHGFVQMFVKKEFLETKESLRWPPFTVDALDE